MGKFIMVFFILINDNNIVNIYDVFSVFSGSFNCGCILVNYFENGMFLFFVNVYSCWLFVVMLFIILYEVMIIMIYVIVVILL